MSVMIGPVEPGKTPRTGLPVWIALGAFTAAAVVLTVVLIAIAAGGGDDSTPKAAATVTVTETRTITSQVIVETETETAPAPGATKKPKPKKPKVPTSFGDGVYEVGVDIAPGRYRNAGDTYDGQAPCVAYTTRKPNDITTHVTGSTSSGPGIIDLESGLFLTVQGCQTWSRE